MKKIILVLFLTSSVSQAQLFGGWIIPSEEPQSCFTGTGDGSSLANTAWSCKYIKDNFPTKPSGLYYIDIDGIGSLPAFRGYCDMSTDGGGWLLIGKSKFTTKGPSKVEMTGDVALDGQATDPWSGGVLPAPSVGVTQVNEFTTPTAINSYLPLGYNGDALQSPADDLDTTAPDELFAILSRNLIESYRVSPCINGDRSKTVFMHFRPIVPLYLTTPAKYYIQTTKRFNPIQHKCANGLSTTICNSATTSGCATEMITDSYSTYNSTTHTTSGLRTIANQWQWPCAGSESNGTSITTNTPSGWFSATSCFYDLSNTDGVTSGSIVDNGLTSSFYYYCDPSANNTICSLTTLWLK